MTNYEKYKDDIIDIIVLSGSLAIIGGKPVSCDCKIRCTDCDLCDADDCTIAGRHWLMCEVKEIE